VEDEQQRQKKSRTWRRQKVLEVLESGVACEVERMMCLGMAKSVSQKPTNAWLASSCYHQYRALPAMDRQITARALKVVHRSIM